MATDIKFNKAGSLRYVAELTPDTPTVVQVKRLDKGYFTVYGSIGETNLFQPSLHRQFI